MRYRISIKNDKAALKPIPKTEIPLTVHRFLLSGKSVMIFPEYHSKKIMDRLSHIFSEKIRREQIKLAQAREKATLTTICDENKDECYKKIRVLIFRNGMDDQEVIVTMMKEHNIKCRPCDLKRAVQLASR